MLGRLVLLLALFAPGARAQGPGYADELIARAGEERLSSEPAWLALGHYRRSRFGRIESQAGGADFFLSKDGASDPSAELEATLRAFFEAAPGGEKAQSPQCRFPARYHWLKERLSFDSARLPEQSCPRFEAWRGAINPVGATLVYANAFLGNPSSMFGHTFLRMRGAGAAAGEDLLDYTINYSGATTGKNRFWEGIEGLTGGLPGVYATDPYYIKVQEYTNMESRDLWEYDLNLDQAAIDQLVRHVWELSIAKFNYYFFTGNCSYQMLTLVDAARPELRLADDFGFGVAPANTVRSFLSRPGLVSAVRYRPSHVTQMKARRARLTSEELSLAARLGKEEGGAGLQDLASLPAQRQALVLDSADDLLRYRKGFANEQSTGTLESEHALLVARGRLGLPPLPADIAQPPGLEQGHDTARVGFGMGSSRLFSYEEVSWRPALHDALAPDAGYLPDSQIEMLNTRLRFDDNDRAAYVERLDLVDIFSAPPWDSWTRPAAWKVSSGIDQAKELGCGPVACMHYDLDGGLGLAAESHFARREHYYALAEADFGAGPVFSDGWRAGGGGLLGVSADETSTLRTTFEASYIAYANSPSREILNLTQAWRLSRDAELRFNLERRVPYEEMGLTFHLYY